MDPTLRGSFLRRIYRSDFSPRELEVIRLVATGLSNKEIAVELGIAVKTVDGYRTAAMRKLGVCNVVRLTHCAIKLGLIEI